MSVKVVAAIDFGTYGSGFAWTRLRGTTDRPADRQIELFSDWPDQLVQYPKNLSALLVRRDNASALELDSWGFQAQSRWLTDPSRARAGYRLRQGFKVSLQPGADPPVDVRGAVEESADDVDELVTVMLRQIYRATVDHLKSRYNGVTLYREDEILWCVTRPAIWGNNAQQRMRRAAVAAGLPDDPARLVLVSEPEAAALYCMVNDVGDLDQPGTRFMVVDAGGGTVDLASYRVDEDGSLEQLAVRDGGKVGSQYLNAQFVAKLLARRFGAAFLERTQPLHPRDYRSLMASWERIKCEFDPARTEPYDLMLPGPLYAALHTDEVALRQCAAYQDGETGSLEFGVAEIRELFDEAVVKVVAIVDHQLDAMRRTNGVTGGEVALLVGGFAGSRYLRDRLTAHLAERDVTVRTPPRPERAVLEGAVHLASDPSVIRARRADLTYGIGISAPFDPERHRRDYRFRKSDGTYNCNHIFDVFVRRGESVRRGSVVSTTITPYNPDHTSIEVSLYSTSATGGDGDPIPQYDTDPAIQLEAEVTLDISGSLGRPRKEREVRVSMKFGESQIEFSAEDVISGKRVETKAEFRKTYFAPSGVEAP